MYTCNRTFMPKTWNLKQGSQINSWCSKNLELAYDICTPFLVHSCLLLLNNWRGWLSLIQFYNSKNLASLFKSLSLPFSPLSSTLHTHTHTPWRIALRWYITESKFLNKWLANFVYETKTSIIMSTLQGYYE